MKPRAGFFEKIKLIRLYLGSLRNKERTKINKITYKRGEITTDITIFHKRIYKQLCVSKLNNLKKWINY